MEIREKDERLICGKRNGMVDEKRKGEDGKVGRTKRHNRTKREKKRTRRIGTEG